LNRFNESAGTDEDIHISDLPDTHILMVSGPDLPVVYFAWFRSSNTWRTSARKRARASLLAVPKLNAKPDPVDIDFRRTAVIVVDMQNAFASRGGMLDIAGADISGASAVVRSIATLLEAARSVNLPVVYLQMGFKPDLSNSGGPESPNWHKELALRLMNCRPELKGKLLIEGTWDFAIVDELKPQPGDLVIVKNRYSGFARTRLDSELRERGIRYLLFAGIATNVCVESTLRDAFFLDYWPVLISDAAMAAGPLGMHDATLFNVESFFGWTVPIAELLAHLHAS
jgi:ureidoacrylate peracid hydrolase